PGSSVWKGRTTRCRTATSPTSGSTCDLLCRRPQDPLQLVAAALELLWRLRLQHQPQERLGVRGADVGPPGGVLDRDAVQVVDLGVLVALGQERDHPLLVLDHEVDL